MSSRKKLFVRLLAFLFSLLLGVFGFAYAQSAPVFTLYDIGTSSASPKTVVIRWMTDALANSQVEYGLDENYGNRSDLDPTQVFSHAVRIINLKPGLIYFYRVISVDAAGNRIASQRFVFSAPLVSLREIPRGATNPPILSFTAPRQHEILKDQIVAFTYQIDGNWPAADQTPHAYLWADVLRNGTWSARADAFDIGSQTNAALRSGSFAQKFPPGTYRIDGILAAYQPKHEMLQGSRVTPLVFTVRDAGSTDVMIASSSPLLALPSGPRIKSGDRIRNWRAADVRQVPLKSNSLIGVQAPDTKGTIIGGPEVVADSRWWNINYDVGYDGWTSEDSLLPVNAPVFDFELVGLDDDHGSSATQGSSAGFSFGGRLTSGAGQTVAFTAQGIPSDAYGIFSPASCVLPCLTTLYISTLRTTPVGIHPITITAISAKKEKRISFKLQINRFSPVPSVSLSAPFLDGTVPGSNLAISSAVTGDADIPGSRSIHFQLDNGKGHADALLKGSRVFADLPGGSHLLTGYLAGNKDVKIPGTDFSLAFVSDASLPVISRLMSQQVGDTSAMITWATDKNSTTRVAYDGVGGLRFSTMEFDTDGRQRTHTVNLQSMVPCTSYFYRAYSKNSADGEAVSLTNRLTTTGCLSTMLSAVHSEGILSTLPHRTLALVRDDDRSASITLPSGFPDAAAVEINGLDPAGITSAVPAPMSQLRLIAGHAYRIVVLKDPSTSVFASDKPVTLTMRYLPEDVSDIIPGSLKIWRWTGVDWTETSQCRTNDDLHEISCVTRELSTFVLFGVSSLLSLAPPPGSLVLVMPPSPAFGAKSSDDIHESTPAVIAHASSSARTVKSPSSDRKKAPPAKSKTPSSPAPLQLSSNDVRILTRDLYRGIKHPEVTLLQRFLVSRNYLEAGNATGFFDGTTETAVKKFQCDQAIVCEGTQSTTGFGSVDLPTRESINALLK
ncbi:MAG: peptidoglycan-binding protein [Candidatus Sungbacteria bacterium]|nr:peptidoglycan-binding protein [Candidatus Sungbacteria bacterium]